MPLVLAPEVSGEDAVPRTTDTAILQSMRRIGSILELVTLELISIIGSKRLGLKCLQVRDSFI